MTRVCVCVCVCVFGGQGESYAPPELGEQLPVLGPEPRRRAVMGIQVGLIRRIGIHFYTALCPPKLFKEGGIGERDVYTCKENGCVYRAGGRRGKGQPVRCDVSCGIDE